MAAGKIIAYYAGLNAGSYTSFDQLINNATDRNTVTSNPVSASVIAISATAIGKLIAFNIGVDTTTIVDVAALTSNSTQMNTIASNTTAVNNIISSEIALNKMFDSATAVTSLESNTSAMNAIQSNDRSSAKYIAKKVGSNHNTFLSSAALTLTPSVTSLFNTSSGGRLAAANARNTTTATNLAKTSTIVSALSSDAAAKAAIATTSLQVPAVWKSWLTSATLMTAIGSDTTAAVTAAQISDNSAWVDNAGAQAFFTSISSNSAALAQLVNNNSTVMWTAAINNSTLVNVLLNSATHMDSLRYNSGFKMALYNSDDLQSLVEASSTALTSLRGGTSYTVVAGPTNTNYTSYKTWTPPSSGTYLVLGVSTSDATSGATYSVATRLNSSTRLNTRVKDSSTGSTAALGTLVLPVVSPYQVSTTDGSSQTMYVGILRCDSTTAA